MPAAAGDDCVRLNGRVEYPHPAADGWGQPSLPGLHRSAGCLGVVTLHPKGESVDGGSVTAQALNFGGAGTQTLDLNGGQLINNGGFAASPSSTFYIGSGELIFAPASGAILEDVEGLVSQPNRIFDDTASVYDSGSGIVVTSIPEPGTFGLLAIFGGALIGVRRFRM